MYFVDSHCKYYLMISQLLSLLQKDIKKLLAAWAYECELQDQTRIPEDEPFLFDIKF